MIATTEEFALACWDYLMRGGPRPTTSIDPLIAQSIARQCEIEYLRRFGQNSVDKINSLMVDTPPSSNLGETINKPTNRIPMKDTSHTTLGYAVPIKSYTSLAEISQAAGGEQKAVDQINKLLVASHAPRLKAAVVAAVSTVTGGKKEAKTSPETFAKSATGKEDAVKAELAKSPVALSIIPTAPVRVKKLKPVPPAWLKEAGRLLAEQGKDKLVAMLKARGHNWTPDTTQALDQGANLESLGRIVQALHVNPLGL